MAAETAEELWCERLNKVFRRSYGGGIAAFATKNIASFHREGSSSASDHRTPDEHTLFEIGSITKVFTAMLLARFSLEGRIDLNAPVSTILPEASALPHWITLLSLSLHSSGLPRIPFRMIDKEFWNMRDPYALFGEAQLLEWLQRFQPRKPPKPDSFNYSNLGVGLLGYILGRVAGSNYKSALRDHILAPLDLSDTVFDLTPGQADRLAQPHATWGRRVEPWTFDALAGAGALRASSADLVKFSRSVLAAAHGAEGPLADTIRATLAVQIAGKMSFMPARCLGWLQSRDKQSSAAIYQHDGGTRGSSSMLFICPQAGFVMLALANTPTTLSTAWRQVRLDLYGLLAEVIAATPRG